MLATSISIPLPTGKIVGRLWRDGEPGRAEQIVREHVRMLRDLLGKDVLLRAPAGYVLDCDACEIDAVSFATLLRESQRLSAAGDHGSAIPLVQEALALWRGRDAMSDVRAVVDLDAEAVRLEESRSQAQELLAACLLAVQQFAHTLPLLKEMVVRHPERETSWLQLMVAETLTGRTREALEVTYRQARHHLVEETGLDAPRMQALQHAIIRGADRQTLLDLVTVRTRNAS